MLPIRLLAAFLLALAVGAAPAAAQEGDGGVAPVEVVDVGGPWDARAIDFIVDAITESDAQLVVLQLDTSAVLTGDVAALVELVRDPPVPVAAWVGPAPAKAFGGAAQVLAAAPIRAAAPGVEIGHLHPAVSGRATGSPADVTAAFPGVPAAAIEGRLEIDQPMAGLVDLVVPTIGQLVVGLDGVSVAGANGLQTLETAREVTGDDGVASVAARARVDFTEGPLFDRILRAAATPEAAFFFLVAGLALVAFEFYAAGVGVMGVVAVACLLLAGYGLAVQPTRWWAVALAVAGLVLYTADFQRNDLGWRSLLGTAALLAGGLFLVDGAPHFAGSWWVVTLVVVGTGLFFGVGMTAVVRARFSTTTIGREHFIGRKGLAVTDIAPSGEVTVDGARWRASGARVGISAGAPVRVIGVDGVVLEVEPLSDGEGFASS